MRKQTKRKVWGLRAPILPLTENHAQQLALQVHVAVAQIDSEAGLASFIDILTKTVLALDYSGRMDKYKRTMLRSALHATDSALKTGRITDTQEALLQRVAGLIDEWCSNGLITYAALEHAKRAMRVADLNIGVDKNRLGD